MTCLRTAPLSSVRCHVLANPQFAHMREDADVIRRPELPPFSPTAGRDVVRRPRAADILVRGLLSFFFFSREESRLHIHVQSAEGEAKYWIDPVIELARNHGLSDNDLGRVEALIEEHEQEIRDAWRRHFGS